MACYCHKGRQSNGERIESLRTNTSKTNQQGKKHFFSRWSKKTGSLYEEIYNWIRAVTKKMELTKTKCSNIQRKTIQVTEENIKNIFMNVK